MKTIRPRNPPAEFRLRFTWSSGFCFKCEEIKQVTPIGELTVGADTVAVCACLLCAWRLERTHHIARLATLRAQLAASRSAANWQAEAVA